MLNFRVLCVLVTACLHYAACALPRVQISIPTLKSDLDWILEGAKYPMRVNINYTDYSVVQLSVVRKPEGQGLCIKIDGTLNIKLADGTMLQKSNVVYKDGSLGFPIYQEALAHIIIKPDENIKATPFVVTISYTSTKKLTKDLRAEVKDIQDLMFYKDTSNVWTNFRIGSSTTPMTFFPNDGRFLLKKPLKGILLHRKNIEGLFDKWHNELAPIDNMEPIGSDESVSTVGLSSYRSLKLPDVFFDVWYDPTKRLYGSSNGPLSGVEAVRIYEDDEWQTKISMLTERTQEPGFRGELIRKKVLGQDLFIAYKRLYSDDPVCDNVVIDYAEEILFDVRRGSRGDDRYVNATGIRLDAQGGKPKHVRAVYDLENLEFFNQVETGETFVAETGARTSFLKYIDWGSFLSHIESVWTAMQGRCTNDGKRVYNFNIIYGEDIKVKYNCDDKTVAVAETVIVLTDIPKTSVTEDILKTAVNKCKNISYQPIGTIEAPCLVSGITAIAVQQQPDKFWLRKFKLNRVNAEVFRDGINVMSDILTEKAHGRQSILGTTLLDDTKLFQAKLGKTGDIRINGNFIQKTASGDINHNELLFKGGELFTPANVGVAITDVGISRTYEVTGSTVIDKYIIASDYLTIEGLKLYLRMVFGEALKRCSSKVNHLWFKLVRYHKFTLDGFCDCYKRFVSVEGQLTTLLFKEVDGITEAHSTGLINNLIYIEDGQILIPGCDNFHEVFAISVPKSTNYKAAQKEFGGPVFIRKNSFIMFKFKEDLS